MIERLLAALRGNAALILGVLGLAFLAASAWTIGGDLGTTLGLAATGAAFLILEWRVS